MSAETSMLDVPYRDLLDAFAAPSATPGGGSAAALAAAMAAALVERCLAAAPAASNQPASLTRARALRLVLAEIAERDADALAGLADALGAASRGDRSALAAAATAASVPAAQLRDAAAETANLAAAAERDGPPRLRGEARCAALLAAAAVEAAQAIIALNEGLRPR
jgi:formiminotetrahydrofolate cyclodeaminase